MLVQLPVHPKTYEKICLRDDILATLDKLEEHAIELNALDALQKIIKFVAEDNDANYLREQFALTDSMESVVQSAMKKFR